MALPTARASLAALLLGTEIHLPRGGLRKFWSKATLAAQRAGSEVPEGHARLVALASAVMFLRLAATATGYFTLVGLGRSSQSMDGTPTTKRSWLELDGSDRRANALLKAVTREHQRARPQHEL